MVVPCMTHIDLSDESTENLLEYIRWKNDTGYEEVSVEAFKVFTYRFQADLLKKLIPVCRGWGYDEGVATEVGYRTFDRFWQRCTFNKERAKQKDIQKAVLFYMFAIAQNELANYKRIMNGEENPYADADQIFTEFPDVENMDVPKSKKAFLVEQQNKLKDLLDRLSWKHRVIYLTYIYYERLTNGKFRLPRKVAENLRNELELTQTSIRVYKNEAFKEAETFLNIYGRK